MAKGQLQTASLTWQDNTPCASDYDDVYFSKDDGCAESQYVFLQQNDLAHRFAQLETTHFTIAETGFGTGLNFLNTWQLWREHRKVGQKLYFISAELHPITADDLSACLAQWPQLKTLAAQLLANYPPPVKGMHCIELEDGVTLILLFDDVIEGFSQLLESSHPNLAYDNLRAVDAWYLDGFSPKQNQAMWRDELFQLMAKLSHRGSTLATFTSAGFVRRGLQAAGFVCQKVKGYGRKREMLRASYLGLPTATIDTKAHRRHSVYGDFWPISRTKPSRSVIVIGAGIAGCTTAWTLAQAGMQVTLIDSLSAPMQEASGNPQAVLFPKLSTDDTLFSQFNLLSLLHAWRFYRQPAFKSAFTDCGVLQLLNAGKDNDRDLAQHFGLDTLVQYCNAEQASQLANTHIESDALFYPQSGFIDTQKLAVLFSQESTINFIGNSPIQSIEATKDGWQANSAHNSYTADAIVLCNAQAANTLLDNPLPSHTIRGQISGFKANHTPELQTVICHQGYTCPAIEQQHYCGASYDLKNPSKAADTASDDWNLQQLHKHLPDFSTIDAQAINGQRVNFRCCTPDYLPLTGPIAHQTTFEQHYGDYKYNAKAFIPELGTYQNGLFVNSGFGSRGFSSAPLAASIIRSYLLSQAYPVPFALMQALNPARFIIRQLSKA